MIIRILFAAVVWSVIGSHLLSHTAAYDWSNFSSGQWTSISSSLPCMPNCSSAAFFTFNNMTYILSRSQRVNLTLPTPQNEVYRWNGTGWSFVLQSAGNSQLPPQCSNSWCYWSTGGTLTRFNPLELNVSRRVVTSIRSPPIFNGSWTSQRVSDNYFVDPLDRWIVFVGGLNGSNVLRLDLVNNFTYSVLLSAHMPPAYSGQSNIVSTLNGDVYTRSLNVPCVSRWSESLQVWHNVTYDLSLLNSQGACCFGPGPLSTDGTNVFVSTGQGTHLFRGDTWQMITNHIINTASFFAGDHLFQHRGRWTPALFPTTGVFFTSRTNQTIRTWFPSHDGDAIFAAFGFEPAGAGSLLTDVAVFVYPPETGAVSASSTGLATRNNNIKVDFATYLGSAQNDTATGLGMVSIYSNDFVVAAINLDPNSISVSNNQISVRSVGAATAGSRGHLIFWNSSSPSQVSRMMRVASSIEQLEVVGRGEFQRIAMIVDGAVLILSATGDSVLWSYSESGVRFFRLAGDELGRVVAVGVILSDTLQKRICLLDNSGALFGSRVVGVTQINDIAATSNHGGMVWIAGHETVAISVRKPMLRAYSLSAEVSFLYSLWPYTAYQLQITANTAASTVRQLYYAQNNQLYYLGEAMGGNTVFRYDGISLNRSMNQPLDDYTEPWNANSATIAHIAQIAPISGSIIRSQFRLTRRVSGFRTGSIFAKMVVDSQGDIFLAGKQECCSPGQQFHRFNCQKTNDTAGAYQNFVMGISADMRRTLFWNTLNENQGSGDIGGFVASQTHLFTLFDTRTDSLFTTPDASFTSQLSVGSTNSDVWFASLTQEQNGFETCGDQAISDLMSFNPPDYPLRFAFLTFADLPPIAPPHIAFAPSLSPVIPAAVVAAPEAPPIAGIVAGALIGVIVVVSVILAVIFRQKIQQKLRGGNVDASNPT